MQTQQQKQQPKAAVRQRISREEWMIAFANLVFCVLSAPAVRAYALAAYRPVPDSGILVLLSIMLMHTLSTGVGMLAVPLQKRRLAIYCQLLTALGMLLIALVRLWNALRNSVGSDNLLINIAFPLLVALLFFLFARFLKRRDKSE